MKDLLYLVLDELSFLKACYAEVRLVEIEEETVKVKNGALESITSSKDRGIGIRVFVENQSGFAGTANLNPERVKEAARLAMAIAQVKKKTGSKAFPFELPKKKSSQFETSFVVDPFKVSLSKKVDLLIQASQTMQKNKLIKLAQASLKFIRVKKTFLNSLGSEINQSFLVSGGEISCLAIKDKEMQKRSYPAAHGGNYRQAGYEFIEELDFLSQAEKVPEEAIALLKAPDCPARETTAVIGSNQMALQIHESVGHPLELDRIFSLEVSLAGRSFVKPEMIGSFQYASPIVNIEASALLPGGLGTFAYDDEGTPGQKYLLIEEGWLKDVLSSCETAPLLNSSSHGTARAESWNRIPIVRMTNVNLLPGNKSFEEIISEVRDGIYLETNKSWSIDDQRVNFQFGVEWAQEIKKGKLGKVFRNAFYTGITPVFWKNCTAVGNENTLTLWGLLNCGKGDPMQTMMVGHQTPVAQFEKVTIGKAK